jgi:hypothetical protein
MASRASAAIDEVSLSSMCTVKAQPAVIGTWKKFHNRLTMKFWQKVAVGLQ